MIDDRQIPIQILIVILIIDQTLKMLLGHDLELLGFCTLSHCRGVLEREQLKGDWWLRLDRRKETTVTAEEGLGDVAGMQGRGEGKEIALVSSEIIEDAGEFSTCEEVFGLTSELFAQ